MEGRRGHARKNGKFGCHLDTNSPKTLEKMKMIECSNSQPRLETVRTRKHKNFASFPEPH